MTSMTTISMKETVNNKMEEEAQKPRLTSKRTVTIVFAVVFGLCIAFAVALSAVYFGYHLRKKADKEKTITVHTPDGVSIQEKVTIRYNEVEVNAPGQFTIINDYNKLLSVFSLNEENGARCYVSNLNVSVIGTPQDIEEHISRPDTFISLDTPQVKYVSSGKTIDPVLLSARAQQICDGIPIVWLSSTTGTQLKLRNKRCSGGEEEPVVFIVYVVVIIEKESCSAN